MIFNPSSSIIRPPRGQAIGYHDYLVASSVHDLEHFKARRKILTEPHVTSSFHLSFQVESNDQQQSKIR
eukprot:scaffold679_cov77-Skeletonema_menzelii.AAC.2